MQIELLIQKGDDRYEVVTNPDKDYKLDFSLFGEGETPKQAIDDLLICYQDMKEMYEEEGKTIPSLTFSYKYETSSFFNYYCKIFSMPALERITGINQKQLHHYAMGIKKPREAQRKKLETALHNLGKELMSVTL